MPIIEIHMARGRTVTQKRELVAGVTDAVVAALGVRADQVRILIDELAPEHFAVSGKTTGQRLGNTEALAGACEPASANSIVQNEGSLL
ncbi:2-hydroxymuconate tautomerase family protein [Telluria mixta]|uniref:Tautomerase n=1 Tax=Telluria mixta TaxID=34071 RepID=A0ABT2C1I1_9BURK|nr:2-hydroxymuconate tautomerase family protein [Telluria mixta]MCS0631243.1 2-hydroxymuconate tautomerase family protein [Telluria mixta]WEM95782.1 2-hydroxymuconate tautomerase family protein [Telluria mixta]